MKKAIVCLVAILAVLSFVGLTSVQAYPYLEVEGFVNPYVGTINNNGDGTTTFSSVEYTFLVAFALDGAEMNSVSVEFENDVFSSIGTVLPNDWSFSTLPSGGSIYHQGTAGTTIPMGGRLTFTLEDVVVYDAALAPGNELWQESLDNKWSQSWSVTDNGDGAFDDQGNPIVSIGEGGSTALVPEPGTLLLLGSGLVGLFYVRRKNIFNT